MTRTPIAVGKLLAAIMLVGVPACTSPRSTQESGVDRSTGRVAIGSFNFAESSLLAEIYAQALEHGHIPVQRELDLGPRELVLPALENGMIDVIPEYLGTALATFASPADAEHATRAEALRSLRAALARHRLVAFDPSAAQDRNGFAVLRSTAERLHLRALSDLTPIASRLVLGGPTECPRRPFCLPGLRRVYGMRFRAFRPFDDGDQRTTALHEGLIDVEVTSTTDGRVATASLVVLRDDRGLQPVESIVPVVSQRAVDRFGPRLARIVNAVSAALDTRSLTFLNWRVEVAGKNIPTEAHNWLQRHGLLKSG